MTFYQWAESTRATLSQVLPRATVVLPIGATEQHGPHLPTGTDFMSVEAFAFAAAREAAADRTEVVLTPTVPFGASDHHFLFGGTLSLRTETVTSVLADLLRSVAEDGGHRVIIVNGHGGNRGACHSASELASVRHGLHVGYVDYWSLIPVGGKVNYPGHAGAFETSMMRHLHPDLVGDAPGGDGPRPYPDVPGLVVHSRLVWQAIDGYSDQPIQASAADGAGWFAVGAAALAAKIREFDRVFGGDC